MWPKLNKPAAGNLPSSFVLVNVDEAVSFKKGRSAVGMDRMVTRNSTTVLYGQRKVCGSGIISFGGGATGY